MSGSGGDKTEQPTPKRLRDARKKGQVPQSKEIVSASLTIAVFGFFLAFGEYYVRESEVLTLIPTKFYEMPFPDALKHVSELVFQQMVLLVLPLVGMVVIVGFLANFFQVGVLFSFESIKPDLNKLNPAQGIKKIFSIKNLMEFIKSIVKVVFLSVVLYIVLRNNIGPLLQLPHCGIDCLLPVLGALFLEIAIYASTAFIIIAGADYAFQRAQHFKQLMMTKEEVKREYKEQEGHPHIKGMRKQLHQQLINEGVRDNVKRSSVVVTNPTRIAVGLYYEQGKTPLPVVTVKGEEALAKRIISIAKEEGIPIMENVPLARALHEQTQPDQYIPAGLIEAVAEVLRWVKEQGGPT